MTGHFILFYRIIYTYSLVNSFIFHNYLQYDLMYFFFKNGGCLTAWEVNKKLSTELQNVALPRVTFINVPLTDNYEARVKLLIPPTVRTSSGNKYPLLIYT